MAVVRWRCAATGRVQGVNYRARVAQAARSRGLVGSVENRPDGTVLIDVQGPADQVVRFLQEVSGPSGSSDASVQRLVELPLAPELLSFVIARR